MSREWQRDEDASYDNEIEVNVAVSQCTMHAINILTCLLVNEEVSICCLVCQLMSIYTVYSIF